MRLNSDNYQGQLAVFDKRYAYYTFYKFYAQNTRQYRILPVLGPRRARIPGEGGPWVWCPTRPVHGRGPRPTGLHHEDSALLTGLREGMHRFD